jgi:hypothetical protein
VTEHFEKSFCGNKLGFVCGVCDCIWFQNNLKRSNAAILQFLLQDEGVQQFMLCSNCWTSVKQGEVPTLSKNNSFTYPPKPTHLPPLEPLSKRLTSRLNARHLRYEDNYRIVGQVINMPCDVDEVVKQLPRHLNDDQAINVNLKKSLIHKSAYLSSYIKKSVLKANLNFLVVQPLYRFYNITVDWFHVDRRLERCSKVTADIEATDDMDIDSETPNTDTMPYPCPYTDTLSLNCLPTS